MNLSKRLSMAGILGIATVANAIQAAIPASAEDKVIARTLKPLAGISLDVGSKRVASYFVAGEGVCDLSVMVAERMAGDEIPVSTATRIVQTIPTSKMARLDTGEGKSLEFGCNRGASAMTVRILNQVAAYEPAK